MELFLIVRLWVWTFSNLFLNLSALNESIFNHADCAPTPHFIQTGFPFVKRAFAIVARGAQIFFCQIASFKLFFGKNCCSIFLMSLQHQSYEPKTVHFWFVFFFVRFPSSLLSFPTAQRWIFVVKNSIYIVYIIAGSKSLLLLHHRNDRFHQ